MHTAWIVPYFADRIWVCVARYSDESICGDEQVVGIAM